ncbi:hypothetical protein ACFQZ8_05250 [Micromonospora azadirachtae]|uniref:Uncharacterized protein n=1 Tax=Micromonospora azadirachtae TaxID=1970735 RepID=A0ABW2ZXX4_9ACTN
MVQVGPDGAFSVNSLGLGGAPFPLSFSVREVDGCWVVVATAAQAAELADVLMSVASETIVIVGLETNSFLDEEYVQWRPSRIAEEQGVSYEAHDVGALASGVAGLSEEVLVICRDDLPRFLCDWYPYELTLVDVVGAPTVERLDEIVLAIGTAAWDGPVLPALGGSRLLFSGHDDCYAVVESTDRSLPARIMGRLLALLVGSALVDASVVQVPEPGAEALESLLEESRHWVGMRGSTSRRSVTVELCATPGPWRLGQPTPAQVDRSLVYDVASGVWRLSGLPEWKPSVGDRPIAPLRRGSA